MCSKFLPSTIIVTEGVLRKIGAFIGVAFPAECVDWNIKILVNETTNHVAFPAECVDWNRTAKGIVQSLGSHSLRNAWIKLLTASGIGNHPGVAFPAECVDWKYNGVSKDRKIIGSHSLRNAWIEILAVYLFSLHLSHSLRNAWISILSCLTGSQRLRSHSLRNAWIENRPKPWHH